MILLHDAHPAACLHKLFVPQTVFPASSHRKNMSATHPSPLRDHRVCGVPPSILQNLRQSAGDRLFLFLLVLSNLLYFNGASTFLNFFLPK